MAEATRFAPNGLAYLALGNKSSKAALVCIHGWGCRGSDFLTLFQILAKQNPQLLTIAPDLPGHGQSPKTITLKITVAGFAELVLATVKDLDLSEVYIAGHSMGCRIALEIWHQSHTQVRAIPVVKGVIFLDGSNYRLRPSLYSFDHRDPRSQEMTAEQKAAKKAELFQSMFSANTPPDFELAQLQHLKTVDMETANAIRDDYVRFDHEEYGFKLAALGKSGTPLLNVQSTDIGPDNHRVPIREGEMSAWMSVIGEKVPQVRQVVVEGSGHFPHVDRVERVAELVAEFMGGEGGMER